MIQLVSRRSRLLATIAWLLILAGAFYGNYPTVAVGMLVMVIVVRSLELTSPAVVPAMTYLRPSYLRATRWVCMIGLMMSLVIVVMRQTGLR